MIKNERQYKITKTAAKKFGDALLCDAVINDDVDPAVAFASIQAMRTQLSELNNEISEYEALRSGNINIVKESSLNELPRTLIKARIAAGLNQRELAQRLGLKEQQIQRYEDNEYLSASFSKLLEVASALDIRVNHSALLGVDDAEINKIFGKLDEIGLKKEFVIRRLSAGLKNNISTAGQTLNSLLPALKNIFLWDESALIGNNSLPIDSSAALTARFKVRKGQNENRLSAYTVYAHYMSLLLVEYLDEVDPTSLPNTAEEFYDNVVLNYGNVNFETVLHFIWSLGIAVIPLNDKATFDGAYWRIGNKHVIAISQRISSSSFWLFDLLHDYFHATQNPELSDSEVIEFPPTSKERRESADEIEASEFAGEVILAGNGENLWNQAYKATQGNIKFLKSKLPAVAESCGVDLSGAANYMAFKLSLDGENWWGSASKFQPENENPWEEARDIFLEKIDFSGLNSADKNLLYSALSDEEY